MTVVAKIIKDRKNQFNVVFYCDYCENLTIRRKSHYDKQKRRFCESKCYSQFRKYRLPKEEQPAYKGGGLPQDEKNIRIKARSDANHALRDGKIKRKVLKLKLSVLYIPPPPPMVKKRKLSEVRALFE